MGLYTRHTVSAFLLALGILSIVILLLFIIIIIVIIIVVAVVVVDLPALTCLHP